jgi:hypothetical protein
MTSNETEIAWAAGLFEGEGTVGVYVDKRGRKPRPSAALSMTDEDVVRRFAAVIGSGSVFGQQPRGRGRKVLWRWQSRSKPTIRAMAAAFGPYLGERRKQQMAAAVAVALEPAPSERTHCPHGHAYSPRNTYIGGRNGRSRFCRTCARDRERARRAA